MVKRRSAAQQSLTARRLNCALRFAALRIFSVTLPYLAIKGSFRSQYCAEGQPFMPSDTNSKSFPTDPDAPPISIEDRVGRLWNPDLAAIPLHRRTWGTYNYAALWVAMSVNIPTYMLASGMIAGGMNWKQAICTVFLG